MNAEIILFDFINEQAFGEYNIHFYTYTYFF